MILTLHQLHRFRPAFDDLIGSKSQRLSALIRGVELTTVNQCTTVVTFTRGGDHRGLASAGNYLLIAKPRFELDDAVLLIFLGEPRKTFGGRSGEGRRSQEEDANENSEDCAELL